MNISLTPELENIVKEKVASGLYNNASEVIRESLRFMKMNEELVDQMKLANLRAHLAAGEADIEAGHFKELGQDSVTPFFDSLRSRAPAGQS